MKDIFQIVINVEKNRRHFCGKRSASAYQNL
jgi:hypothetical protein